MTVDKTNLKNALLLKPRVFEDSRGRFFEPWNRGTFDRLGLSLDFVQDNVSFSKENVLRGLHYQSPNPQGKLVSVLHGEVYDVIVDLREYSSTFGQWQGFFLSDSNQHMLYVPEGFAHGFLTLSKHAVFSYKCTSYYDPSSEHTLMWDDPILNIEWPLSEDTEPIVSPKDGLGNFFTRTPKFK
jgi:dTDP-4-dehydrorhamnose 3,5-epimerase